MTKWTPAFVLLPARHVVVWAVLLLVSLGVAAAEPPVAAELRAVATRPPPEVFPATEIKATDPRVRPLFFAGPIYQGQPTRVFAWLGLPEKAAGEKVPGIVLLHGAGGTAFESWVTLWVDRGYAAIAIDHWGTLPLPLAAKPRPPNPEGGPPGGSGAFGQLGRPLQDQWPYQAVSAAILAHSLLLAQPGVDADRTGVTGISWGGYLTCLMAGLDERLKFAVPVYGCGHYEETIFAAALAKLPPERSALWYAQWDAKNYIPAIRIPVLWVNGTNDKFFWPPAWQKSHGQMPAALRTISLHPGMQHGHPPAGDPPEIRAFADSVVRGGEGLPQVVAIRREGEKVSVDFQASGPLSKAELIYTADTKSPWARRQWQSVPAEVARDSVHAVLPPEARIYYMTLRDARDLPVSTNYEQLP